MFPNRKIVGTSAVAVLLFVFLASQIYAQSPTATPSTETPENLTPTPSPSIVLSTRQAVVKQLIDGDSIEVVFVDGGQIATIDLANVDAPESVLATECFGRESAEYATQAYQSSPLISIELVGEIKDGKGAGYVHLADGTLLNHVMVLFGYARYDDTIKTSYSEQIEDAESQSKKGNVGLWRNCGATEESPKPCFIFSQDGIDSASMREALDEYPDRELSTSFRHAYYDPIQHEIIVTWVLYLDSSSSGQRVREYFRLPDCLRDRSEVYQR